jgi:hypothetical protein
VSRDSGKPGSRTTLCFELEGGWLHRIPFRVWYRHPTRYSATPRKVQLCTGHLNVEHDDPLRRDVAGLVGMLAEALATPGGPLWLVRHGSRFAPSPGDAVSPGGENRGREREQEREPAR